MTTASAKRITLSCFGVFFVVGALLGFAAVMLKGTLPRSTIRFGGLLYFGAFFLVMSVAEIWAGEIHTTVSGPPTCTKEAQPTRFWFSVTLQLAVAVLLLAACMIRIP